MIEQINVDLTPVVRSQTMIALVQWFEASGMTQAQAATSFGIPQTKFNQLLKGKIETFSLDALVKLIQLKQL